MAKPYFLWDYNLSEKDVKRILRQGTEYDKRCLKLSEEMLREIKPKAGFSLIGIIITLAVLILTTAGGVVVWEKKVRPTTITEDDESLVKCLDNRGCEEGYKCFYGYDRPCPRGYDCSALTFNKVGDDKCHKLCNSDSDCPEGYRCVHKQAFQGDVETVYDKLCVQVTFE